MSIEFASGVFALAGVLLTAVLSEFRAGRETRNREAADLLSLKRRTYGTALQHCETVASQLTHWINAGSVSGPDATRPFWDALTAAYQTQNEIRLLSRTEEPADAMKRLLSVYRQALENGDHALPKSRDLRNAMIASFRHDLGLGR